MHQDNSSRSVAEQMGQAIGYVHDFAVARVEDLGPIQSN